MKYLLKLTTMAILCLITMDLKASTTIAQLKTDYGTEKIVANCNGKEKKRCTSWNVEHVNEKGEVVSIEALKQSGMNEMLNDLRYEIFNSENYQGWLLLGNPALATSGVLCLTFGCNDSGKENYGLLLLLPLGLGIDLIKLPVSLGAGGSYLIYKSWKLRHFKRLKRDIAKDSETKRTIDVKDNSAWSLITFRLKDGIYRRY